MGIHSLAYLAARLGITLEHSRFMNENGRLVPVGTSWRIFLNTRASPDEQRQALGLCLVEYHLRNPPFFITEDFSVDWKAADAAHPRLYVTTASGRKFVYELHTGNFREAL